MRNLKIIQYGRSTVPVGENAGEMRIIIQVLLLLRETTLPRVWRMDRGRKRLEAHVGREGSGLKIIMMMKKGSRLKRDQGDRSKKDL